MAKMSAAKRRKLQEKRRRRKKLKKERKSAIIAMQNERKLIDQQTLYEKYEQMQKQEDGPHNNNGKSKKNAVIDDNPDSMVVQNEDGVEIEYVAADGLADIDPDDEHYYLFKDVFEHFKEDDPVEEMEEEEVSEESEEVVVKVKKSRKKKKLESRYPIAVLKQLVDRPDLVEIHDTCAADPFMLIHFKSYRAAVPVPVHWSQKRKYLQGKRGVEKDTFDLPQFIKDTGIQEIRGVGLMKDATKSLNQTMRERLNPHLGKMDISYETLHDAFFVHQVKPEMGGHGDLYYEGKEYEVEMKEKRPGQLSQKLKEALGMPDGAPPPWLINMQRLGPPPSYPKLKIPGLTAPIPPNAQYGFQPGGWGRPPVDHYNRPLFGDPFGVDNPPPPDDFVPQQHWGVVLRDAEEAVEILEESEESFEQVEIVTEPALVVAGMEEGEDVEFSKPRDVGEQSLYTVLKEKTSRVRKDDFMGSTHTYEIAAPQNATTFDMSLDPEDLTEEGLTKQYNKALNEKSGKSISNKTKKLKKDYKF
eukprot:TRINITY_DN7033_c0_g1_i1.p1 TRINITY_DN7033_c0_g1~~TRINITY_DN7033_c0_g1_i1.p1  ORF type:complete len:528 (+),score=176.35 TRINITY_DN7033_c0_g1_i1:69-1652(+)